MSIAVVAMTNYNSTTSADVPVSKAWRNKQLFTYKQGDYTRLYNLFRQECGPSLRTYMSKKITFIKLNLKNLVSIIQYFKNTSNPLSK